MNNILDLVAAGRTRIRPTTPSEFLSLAIARRLNDEAGARAYMGIAQRFPPATLIAAYHRARIMHGASAWERFRAALDLSKTSRASAPHDRLIAVAVHPRAAAVAVLSALHLEYTQVREFSRIVEPGRALLGFISWSLEQFPSSTLVLPQVRHGENRTRRAALVHALESFCAEQAVPFVTVAHRDLAHALAHPAVLAPGRARDVVEGFWPMLAERHRNRMVTDAAGLALYASVSRLLDAEGINVHAA